MSDLIKKISNKNYDEAKSLFEEKMISIIEKKMVENKKAIGAKLEQITMTRKAFDGSMGARAEKLYRGVIEEDPIDEQAAPAFTPSGEADSDRLRDMIRSRMKSATSSSDMVGTGSAKSPSIQAPKQYGLPFTKSEPSIPANAKQFSLPKTPEPPKPSNVNIPKNLPSVSDTIKNVVSKASPLLSKIKNLALNPYLGTAFEVLRPDPTNVGEPDYVKQNVEKQIAKDKADAEKTNKMLQAKPQSKGLETSKAAGQATTNNKQDMTMPSLRPTTGAEPMKMPDVRPTKSDLPKPDVQVQKSVATEPAKPVTPPKRPVTPTPDQPKNYDDLPFPVAFARAREAAAKLDPKDPSKHKLKWRGQEFQTNFANERYVSKHKSTVSTDKGPSAYEKKLAKMTPEKAAANIKLQTPKWAGGYGNNPALQEETELDEARIKIVGARIRGGKVQRRKKVSNVPGYTLRGGGLKRMSASERRNRRLGQRRGKIKRKMKLSRTLVKRQRSLRKRQSLGIK